MGGLRLSIHPLFYAFGVYYALTGNIFVFLIYTIVALLHELGHSFAAERRGYRLNKITLMPYGAVISGNTEGLKPSDEVAIAAAGPLTNLAVAVLFIAAWWVYPLSYAFTDTAAVANLSIAAINLLPVFPLDGGRILLALLSSKIKKSTAEKICKGISLVFGAALFIVFIVLLFFGLKNFSLAFFSGFIIFGALNRKKENSYVKLYTGMNSAALKRGMPYKKQGVSEEITIKKLINILDASSINEIVVYRGNNAVRTLGEKQILEITQNFPVYTKLKDAVDKTAPQ